MVVDPKKLKDRRQVRVRAPRFIELTNGGADEKWWTQKAIGLYQKRQEIIQVDPTSFVRVSFCVDGEGEHGKDDCLVALVPSFKAP